MPDEAKPPNPQKQASYVRPRAAPHRHAAKHAKAQSRGAEKLHLAKHGLSSASRTGDQT